MQHYIHDGIYKAFFFKKIFWKKNDYENFEHTKKFEKNFKTFF